MENKKYIIIVADEFLSKNKGIYMLAESTGN